MNLSKNIVLIGMPGSGKTTIGKKVATSLSMDFIDIDQYIEMETGTSIFSLFKKGERYFRRIESEVIQKLYMPSCCVISTGGGTILNPSNMEKLQKNAITFFIDRNIDKILEENCILSRPLLRENPSVVLHDIYNKRRALYNKYANYVIKADSPVEDITVNILDIYISRS